MEPLISVVIPVYNVEKYLKRCLNSVLNQTYKNLEIIVVNDGSQDGSANIIDEYSKKYSNIIPIHQKNGGLSMARNAGIKICKGKYITFIDSDDYVDKTMISRMYKVLEEEKVNLVQCDFKLVYDGNFCNEKKITKPIVLNRQDMFDTRKTKITAWGKLYLTEIVRNILFKENMINEDEFFTYKALYESNKIALIQEPLYCYYQSPNSITRNSNHYIKLDFMKAYDERIKYFNDKYEKKLCEISKKEYCIRLMLAYIKTINNSEINNDEQIFFNSFKKNYEQIKDFNYLDKKEIIILKFFYFSPKIFAKLWGMIT